MGHFDGQVLFHTCGLANITDNNSFLSRQNYNYIPHSFWVFFHPGQTQVVRLLLENGADTEIRDVNDWKIIQLASLKGITFPYIWSFF